MPEIFEGRIDFGELITVSTAEMKDWSALRIIQFFQGIAAMVRARDLPVTQVATVVPPPLTCGPRK